ncbi:MAG: CpxP family protein [Vibrio sp.]
MKSLMKKSALVLLAAPLAFGSVSALAAGPSGHSPMMGHGQKCGMGMERGIWKQLDLTDAQKDQLKTLREKDREAMKKGFAEHKDEMKANHDKMDALVMADNFDQAAVESLAKNMADQGAKVQVAMAKSRHDKFAVLTADQKEKFKTLKADQEKDCAAQWEKMKDRFEKAHGDKDAK